MPRRRPRPFGRPDHVDHVAHVLRRFRGEPGEGGGDGEIDQHADGADAFRGYAEQPFIRRIACAEPGRFEPDDIAKRENEAGDHAGDRALAVHAFKEDAHEDRGEERSGGEAEGERDHLRDEAGRVDP